MHTATKRLGRAGNNARRVVGFVSRGQTGETAVGYTYTQVTFQSLDSH